MNIGADLIRGHTDSIILALLVRGDSYGYEINKQISQSCGGQLLFKEATLYTAFRRLEEAGLITSYWGDQGAGARRKYYKITPAGREMHRHEIQKWESTRSILDTLLLDKGGTTHA